MQTEDENQQKKQTSSKDMTKVNDVLLVFPIIVFDLLQTVGVSCVITREKKRNRQIIKKETNRKLHVFLEIFLFILFF